MERAIEAFAVINFVVIGLSHIFQHRAWGQFFVMLHRQGRPGAFVNGFLSLLTGSLIVAFHNVWTGIPTVLTILGWGMVIKSLVVFTAPDKGLRSMALVTPDNSRSIAAAGGVFLVLAAVLGYSLWRG
jgi:hypothetical protein